MIPFTDADIIAQLFDRIERLESRLENRKRTGLIKQVNNQERWARVDLGPDPVTGEAMMSAKIPWDEPAMGAMRTHTPRKVGEQVTVESENGEWSDARIKSTVPSDAHAAPNGTHPEGHVRTIGNLTIVEKDGLCEVVVGQSKITITPDGIALSSHVQISITAPTVAIEGFVKVKGDMVTQGGITSSGVHKAAGHT